LEKGYPLFTIDNALVECLNIIWKHATLLRDLNIEDTKSAIDYILEIFDRINVVKTIDIAEQTMTIAQTLKIPVYDALYVAVAQKENGTLYTTDKKLAKTANTITTTKLLKPS
jgi:predicted nucleic acid-binding protein